LFEGNVLLEKMRQDRIVLGLGNMYPASGIVEGMCRGWDFVWIDGQHGEMSYDSILHAVQAARGAEIATLLRVPGHEHSVLGRYADLSPAAVMIPMVDNPEQARHVAAGLRFPPLGNRSYGGRRVIDLHGREYYREQDIVVVAQIETLEAAVNAPDIIRTEGIDCLFFGPDDMKVRMGIPVNTPITESAELREAMQNTARAARDAGKFAGCVAANPAAIEMSVELGFQLIVGGGDIVFLRTAAAARLEELRTAADQTVDRVSAEKSSGVY